MKALVMGGLLLLAAACLVAVNQPHQEPMVTLKRAYGVPPGHTWRPVFAVPQSKLWMGIVLRDSISGRTEAYLVEWPACVLQRAE